MKTMKFEYKNWKGVTRIREVIPVRIWFGEVTYHKGEQWLLEASDIEDDFKGKNFALKDIIKFM